MIQVSLISPSSSFPRYIFYNQGTFIKTKKTVMAQYY